ncbi:MAG: hypothetical protein A2939_01540 [Parcubacteria group bacterium RIFCSPLOWO2_01_FULL_48_18]|nr:MAG: hypothetical protein A2939_01540 [Parcubacteria group bacterium RIFCSPLOWO2_01_FULL_48_18]
MKKLMIVALSLGLLGGSLFLLATARHEIILDKSDVGVGKLSLRTEEPFTVPEYEATISDLKEPLTIIGPAAKIIDIAIQKPLAKPPDIVKAIYATSWSVSSANRMKYFSNLIETTELNAIVIDIKDFSGYVAYDSELDLVRRYGAEQIRIPKLNALIKELHDKNIYVIARISVFQDPVLAKAWPDLAIKSSSTGAPWQDRKGLLWIDPASQEAWDYNIAIAKEAARRGFDEINFDYVRFPSDGDLEDMVFPYWDRDIPKSEIIENFFKYLHDELRPAEDDSLRQEGGEAVRVKLSVDLFGLSTARKDDLGIGQVLENAVHHFNFISPMVYPSHYSPGFLGYDNPAEHPYEIVRYSAEQAFKRLLTEAVGSNDQNILGVRNQRLMIALRPWLQDFDLGADYDASMVRAQIQGLYDAWCNVLQGSSASSEDCEPEIGWMLWSPSNVYTKEALTP